jgi:hypothetical protein
LLGKALIVYGLAQLITEFLITFENKKISSHGKEKMHRLQAYLDGPALVVPATKSKFTSGSAGN